MGIKNLTKLLYECAPAACREVDLKSLMGRKIALDASGAIYQFLIAVRSSDGSTPAAMLTNEAGEVTSHLQGLFNRSIRLMENGIKPVYVFDGEPPELKSHELSRRKAVKEKATESFKEATENGTREEIERFSKRTVRMTQQHQDDCKELLRLMGMPVIDAPCEAEAQCAAMARQGVVWAAGSEDMDTLTFNTSILIRRLAFSELRKLPILQFDLDKALEGLGVTLEQFVDICILCGCDYCGTIRGIGPKTSYNLIKKHGNLETVLESLDKDKYPLPENFDYEGARKLFLHHNVLSADVTSPLLKWGDPDEENLTKFLVETHGFNPQRVTSGLTKLKAAKGKANQSRLDSFFGRPATTKKTPTPTKKRTGVTGKSSSTKKARK